MKVKGTGVTENIREQQALKLYEDGTPITEITKNVRCSATTLYTWIHAAGVSRVKRVPASERVPNDARPCKKCGASFKPKSNTNGLYCSKRCYQADRETQAAIRMTERLAGKEKQCFRCLQILPADQFAMVRCKVKKGGYNEYPAPNCKEGSKQYSVARYRSDRGSHKKLQMRLHSVHTRCRDLNLACDIDIEFLNTLLEKQHGLCFYSGRPLNNGAGPDTISIDRRDATGPYTKDNVVLSTWQVNRMKSNISEDTFLSLCDAISDRRRKLPQ